MGETVEELKESTSNIDHIQGLFDNKNRLIRMRKKLSSRNQFQSKKFGNRSVQNIPIE